MDNLFKPAETRRKSLLKAVSWRVIGTLDTFIISYFVTGSAKLGAGIAAIEVVTKMILYYLHERAWSRIK